MAGGRLEKLGKTMNRALKGLDLDQRLRESRAMAVWAEVVGETTAARAKPSHVNRGTMVINVTSSAWAMQLNLMKPRFLQALAVHVGPDVIRDLRWRVGEGASDTAAEPGSTPAPLARPVPAARPAPVPLPAAELAAIEQELKAIADPRLTIRLRATLEAQAARRHRLALAGWIPCTACGVLHNPLDPAGSAVHCPPCRQAGGEHLVAP